MAKNKINGNYSVSKKGSVVCELFSEEGKDKRFAAFLKCGHCGKLYFIPVIFTATCKDVEAAKEILLNTPRIKYHNKGAVIDIFEISEIEFKFINTVNYRHDPYLNPSIKGIYDETNEMVIGRRIASENCLEIDENRSRGYMGASVIHTQEDYNQIWNMFERNFAPIRVGDKIVYSNVNRQQAMRDFYYSCTIRYGILNGDNYLIALYYLLYGKDNELGVTLDEDKISFRSIKDKEKIYTRMLIPEIADKIKELNDGSNESHILSYRYRVDGLDDILRVLDKQDSSNHPSQIDKFNARMAKINNRPSQIDKFNARLAKSSKAAQTTQEPENE